MFVLLSTFNLKQTSVHSVLSEDRFPCGKKNIIFLNQHFNTNMTSTDEFCSRRLQWSLVCVCVCVSEIPVQKPVLEAGLGCADVLKHQ